MFDKQRFMTRGIESVLTPALILFLWTLIDEMCQSNHSMDYLQVFNLFSDKDATGSSIQVVKHTQEEPQYQAIYNLYLPDNPVNAKVYIIDDITHCTMLLASEY